MKRVPEAQIQDAVDAVLDEAQIGRAHPQVRVAPQSDLAVDDREGETPKWAESFVRMLDDGMRIPGTQIRFGLDGIIGMFVPVAGDAVTGVSSITLLFLALKERVPTVILGKMVLNILFDTLLGAIPFLGDAFDFIWKANRKNLELIELYRDDPDAEPSFADYALVGIGIFLALASIALPFIVTYLFVQAGASLAGG